MIFGDLDDPTSEISKVIAEDKTEALHPEYNLKEKVRYIGLPKRFVAGAVVFGDTDECAEGAAVTLDGEGEKKTLKADNYGNFEFEGLSANNTYLVTIKSKNYKSQRFTVKTNIDVYLGDIVLKAVLRRK